MDFRGIEKAWRVVWMRAIGRALPGPRGEHAVLQVPMAIRPGTQSPGQVHDRENRPLKVLFLRYERIGDLIMATGMIRVLAQSHPAIRLDVLANPTTRPVLDNNPYVRQVFTLDRKSWVSYLTVGLALRREHYDIIIDGRINNPLVFTSTPLMMLLAGAPYRIGVGGGYNELIYNVPVRPYDRTRHYVEGSKALAEPFGVAVDQVSWQAEIILSDKEVEHANAVWVGALTRAAAEGRDGIEETDQRRLLVNLSASEPKRRWPDEHFIDVLQAVRSAHPRLAIVVIGLPREWASVQRVAASVNATPAQTPQLREALALVGTSDRVFTPDTSISHAASAFRRPTVVLLKRDCHPYAPWKTPGEIVFWDGETIQELAVEQVRASVLRLVAA